MNPVPTEADRLAYEDTPVTLADGRAVRLHFGFGGLRRLEQHFGSVVKFGESLNAEQTGMVGFYDAVLYGMHAALWRTGLSIEELEDLLDPSKLDEYLEPLGQAYLAAFPRKAQETAKTETNRDAEAETTESNGPGATTSSPLSSNGVLTTSGA